MSLADEAQMMKSYEAYETAQPLNAILTEWTQASI